MLVVGVNDPGRQARGDTRPKTEQNEPAGHKVNELMDAVGQNAPMLHKTEDERPAEGQ